MSGILGMIGSFAKRHSTARNTTHSTAPIMSIEITGAETQGRVAPPSESDT